MQPPGAIQNSTQRLYIGSIPLDITQAQIEALFSPFGHILKVDWSQHDTVPTMSKGYCFVWYSDPASSILALEHMNGFEIDSRAIKVSRPSGTSSAPTAPAPATITKRATSTAEALAAALGTLNPKVGSGARAGADGAVVAGVGAGGVGSIATTSSSAENGSISSGTAVSAPVQAGPLGPPTAASPLLSFDVITTQYIKMKNIPHSLTEQDIFALFKGFGVDEVRRCIPTVLEAQVIAAARWWSAQLHLNTRLHTHEFLYTMSSNAGPFNHYLMQLHTEMLSSGDSGSGGDSGSTTHMSSVIGIGSSNSSGFGIADGNDQMPNLMHEKTVPVYAISFELIQEKDAVKPEGVASSKEALTSGTGTGAAKLEQPGGGSSRSGSSSDAMDVDVEGPVSTSISTAAPASQTVRLLHMVTLDDTEDPDLQADIAEEAGAFGLLLDCLISVVYDPPPPPPPAAAALSSCPETGAGGSKPSVFVYLTYSTYADACTARDTMHGKFFGDSGIQVVAQLVDDAEVLQRKRK